LFLWKNNKNTKKSVVLYKEQQKKCTPKRKNTHEKGVVPCREQWKKNACEKVLFPKRNNKKYENVVLLKGITKMRKCCSFGKEQQKCESAEALFL